MFRNIGLSFVCIILITLFLLVASALAGFSLAIVCKTFLFFADMISIKVSWLS